MAKSLYDEINNAGRGQGMTFPEFMQMMKGRDPNQILNEMVRSGQVNQQQLDAVQKIASQKMGVFERFKSMFGF